MVARLKHVMWWLVELVAGLYNFVVRVLVRAARDRASAYAAQVAFYILMSVFPFAILILQLISVAPVSQESMLFVIDNAFPDYLLSPLHSLLQEVYSSHYGLVPVLVVTMLWTTSKVMHAMVLGLDAICTDEAERSRNWFTVRAWSLVCTGMLAILMVLVAASTVLWNPLRIFLMRHRPYGVSLSTYGSAIRTVYTLLIGTFLLAGLYKFVPRRRLRYRAQLPGAFIAILSIYVFTIGIAIYVSNFNGFSVYGSLTTLTLIMFWLYFSCDILLIGAAANEELRQTQMTAKKVIVKLFYLDQDPAQRPSVKNTFWYKGGAALGRRLRAFEAARGEKG